MIEVEHLGETIRYSEDTDRWLCLTLDVSEKSLKGAKDKLNKIDAAERRVTPLAALLVELWADRETPVTITLVADDRKSVWITKGQKRDKAKPEELVPDTPEVRRVIDQMMVLRLAANKSRKEIDALRDSLPRVTIEQLLGRKDNKA